MLFIIGSKHFFDIQGMPSLSSSVYRCVYGDLNKSAINLQIFIAARVINVNIKKCTTICITVSTCIHLHLAVHRVLAGTNTSIQIIFTLPIRLKSECNNPALQATCRHLQTGENCLLLTCSYYIMASVCKECRI